MELVEFMLQPIMYFWQVIFICSTFYLIIKLSNKFVHGMTIQEWYKAGKQVHLTELLVFGTTWMFIIFDAITFIRVSMDIPDIYEKYGTLFIGIILVLIFLVALFLKMLVKDLIKDSKKWK